MKLALILFATALSASAAGLTGTWKAVFTGPLERRPKMVSEIVLKLNAEGTRLTGTVHASNWPGDGPLLDGRIDGDRITFTFIGKSPWWSNGPAGAASGLPLLNFTAILHDNEMQMTLLWDSVMLSGSAPPGPTPELEMKATRLAD